MDPGFRGEVAEFYAGFRRGYPPAVGDGLVDAFGLTADDIVVDLGCGTGQLTVPMAGRVRAVVGVDQEPDMLVHARRAAHEHGVTNASWLLGADTDLPGLAALFGDRALGAVTIGQALHWMRPESLFPALAPLVRPGGGVAVVTNGIPLWLHDTAWSRALRELLEGWLGHRLTATCGTDDASQGRYRDLLAAAGFDVLTRGVDHTEEIGLDYVIGNVYSALSVDLLPTRAQRQEFEQRLRDALRPHQPIAEDVRVRILIGRAAQASVRVALEETRAARRSPMA